MRTLKTSEARRLELEQELDLEKQRFVLAAQEGLEAIKRDLAPLAWLRRYPREAALLLLVGGVLVARRLLTHSEHDKSDRMDIETRTL